MHSRRVGPDSRDCYHYAMNLSRWLSVVAAYPKVGMLCMKAAALSLSCLLIACSPEFDWREIRSQHDRFQVLMPARVASMTEPVQLDDLKAPMTLHGARVRDLSFTVGAVELAAEQVARREHAQASMRAAMVRNIGGTERSHREVMVPRVDASGASRGSVPALEIEATGRMKDREVTLLARFASDGDRVWQAVVLGPHPDAEQARLFLDSLRIISP